MDLIKFINKAIMKNLQTIDIYVLDRNIISIIKDRNANKSITDKNKQNILDCLNRINCSKSIVSPIFSLFEGQHGRMECVDEISDTVNKELEALEIFFGRKKVDRSLIESEAFLSLFKTVKNSNEYHKNIKAKINFLNDINKYLYQPLHTRARLDIRDKIISIQREKYGNYFDNFNPIVIAALCCIYGSNVCRKILKPKEDINKTNYYNAVMDFQHFDLFVYISGKMEGKYNKKYNAKNHLVFLSGDKNLNNFFSWYDVYHSKSLFIDGVLKSKMMLSKTGALNIPNELNSFFNI